MRIIAYKNHRSTILSGVVFSLLAGIAPVSLSTVGNASPALVDTSQPDLPPMIGEFVIQRGASGIGIMQSGRQSRLDPRLAGMWYWEADSVYVPGTDILIKATSMLTISRDGRFTLQEEGTELGVSAYRGQFVQQGDSLTGYCDNGQTFATRFTLNGSSGLWIGGRLYGRH